MICLKINDFIFTESAVQCPTVFFQTIQDFRLWTINLRRNRFCFGFRKCLYRSSSDMVYQVPKDLSGGLHFSNGKRGTIKSRKSFPVYEPRTGNIVAQCPVSEVDHVAQIVNAADDAQEQWAKKTALQRGSILRKAAEIIREHLEELAIWEVRGNGKPIYEARVDIESSADTFEFYGGIAPAALQGEYIELPGGAQERFAYTRKEPFGVVGAIGAWNYPFQTAVWKIAPALAAGNAVVYKPSPFAPISAVFIAEILSAAGLPPNVFNIVQGEAETGEALTTHEKVRKVTFTGSLATGQKIQKSAANSGVKPVTLELGGKSPLIIFDDTNIDNAVAGAMLANFLNQGQVCTNATRVFVQNGLVDAFSKRIVAEVEKTLVVGDPLKECTRIGATINEQQLQRVIAFVESAKEEGARVLIGGKRVHPVGVENGFYFAPTVITDLNDSMKIVREEIFGAVMLILPFETEEEVVRRANDTPYGLAAGVFSGNLGRAHRVAARLNAGTIYINTYNDTEVDVPFGGFKSSGVGRENSIETLQAFTQTKAIYVNVSDKLEHCFGTKM